LQASLEVNGKRLFFRINDDWLRVYPLQIDPLIQLRTDGIDGTKGNLFGSSVAMSGNTVVIGAPEAKDGGNQSCRGGLRVRQARQWLGEHDSNGKTHMRERRDLRPCGSPVAISGDTIVTSGYDPTISQYVTLVFVEPSGGWRTLTQTAELTGSDGARLEEGINSVAISGDTILAGDPISSVLGFEEGEVYLYVKPAGGWSNHDPDRILSLRMGKKTGSSVGRSRLTVR